MVSWTVRLDDSRGGTNSINVTKSVQMSATRGPPCSRVAQSSTQTGTAAAVLRNRWRSTAIVVSRRTNVNKEPT